MFRRFCFDFYNLWSSNNIVLHFKQRVVAKYVETIGSNSILV